jgi:Asp-tRNA(Asn)/Glu-tRNA(Gln) amidotransferase A subunit family amidase
LYHPKTVDLIRRGQSVPAETLAKALVGRQQLQEELAVLMDRHSIDLWISPSATGAAPKGLESTGDPVMNLPWTYAGLPALGLPSGVNSAGLPFGLQVVARWNEDEALLTWGRQLEGEVPRQRGEVEALEERPEGWVFG